MSVVPRHRFAFGLAGVALIASVSACGGDATVSSSPATVDPSSPPASAASPAVEERAYRLGISNGVEGDPWRAAMVCTMKAEARTSGRVDRVVLADRGTDAEGQVADVRNLLATGVDAIVVHPRDPAALVEVAAEAVAKDVVVVAVGRAIPTEGTYAVVTDQDARGAMSATWLVEALGGKGRVVYLRGDPDDLADQEREAGVRRVLEGAPDIEIVAELTTKDDPAVAVEGINALIAKPQPMDGILTTGPDSVVVDALKTAEAKLVPIAGGDRGAFVSQLLAEENLVGAAVTDPPAVGGAAVALAIGILDGEAPTEPILRIAPEVWPNDSDAGRAQLTEANDPEIELGWPLSLTIPGRTSYAVADAVACLGPGD